VINIEKKHFLTYDDLSIILDVKKGTIYNWMNQGRFKQGRDYIKLGRGRKSKVLFKKDIINRLHSILG